MLSSRPKGACCCKHDPFRARAVRVRHEPSSEKAGVRTCVATRRWAREPQVFGRQCVRSTPPRRCSGKARSTRCAEAHSSRSRALRARLGMIPRSASDAAGPNLRNRRRADRFRKAPRRIPTLPRSPVPNQQAAAARRAPLLLRRRGRTSPRAPLRFSIAGSKTRFADWAIATTRKHSQLLVAPARR